MILTNKMLFKQFLKDHKTLIFCLTLLSLTYFICFLIFRVNYFIFLYPTIIFYLIFIIYCCFEYNKFKKKYLELKQILNVDVDQIVEIIDTQAFDSMELKEFYKIVEKIDREFKKLKNQTKYQNNKLEEDISTWIHQIKIPITAMKLNLEDIDSNQSRELKSELFRIELYVEMILNYFRLKSLSTDYIFVKTDINLVIRNELKRFASEFIKRKITLELHCETFNYVTDEKWLAFVFDQIISNALKYTPNGGVIKISFIDDNLIIEDSGIGISSNDLPRIFERGYTGYNGRIDKRASGLGLYLTKQVCDNLNIPIQLESKLNKGTKVILDLKNTY